MKLKTILISVLAVCLFALVGCGSSSTSSQSASVDKNNSSSPAKNTKKADSAAVMGFELNMIEDLHVAIKPVNDLVTLGNSDSFDANTVKKSADAAAKSAQDYAAKIKNYSLPSSMSSTTKKEMTSALSDLAQSFQERADAAKACANVTSKAELQKAVAKIDAASKDSFQSFQTKMDAIHKSLGLINNNFSLELQ